MSEFISVFFCFRDKAPSVPQADYMLYNPPASFALQALAAPITRKFLGCWGIFSKIPRVFSPL